MAEYTLLNPKNDVENMAERYGLAPDLEARSPLGLSGGGFSYQKLTLSVPALTGIGTKSKKRSTTIIRPSPCRGHGVIARRGSRHAVVDG